MNCNHPQEPQKELPWYSIWERLVWTEREEGQRQMHTQTLDGKPCSVYMCECLGECVCVQKSHSPWQPRGVQEAVWRQWTQRWAAPHHSAHPCRLKGPPPHWPSAAWWRVWPSQSASYTSSGVRRSAPGSRESSGPIPVKTFPPQTENTTTPRVRRVWFSPQWKIDSSWLNKILKKEGCWADSALNMVPVRERGVSGVEAFFSLPSLFWLHSVKRRKGTAAASLSFFLCLSLLYISEPIRAAKRRATLSSGEANIQDVW